MSSYVNVSSTWKLVKYSHVNVNGSWKSCNNIYVNANGTWRPLHAYWWNVGGWETCSASCGGGTQTRSVTCMRSDYTDHNLDQISVSDSLCSKFGLTKPSTSQTCNTQACMECKYTTSINWTCMTNSDVAKNYCFILWNGTIASKLSHSVTSYTKNGYLYTKGPLAYDNSAYNTKYYQACRQLI